MQGLFHQDDAKTKGIFGGNRSGKTEEGAEYMVKKCLEKPKQRWWACAESFSDSVNIQQRKVHDIVPKNRIKYGRYDEINGFTNRKLLFDNGSIIIFKSYDQQRESFQSDDIDGIWDDEEPPWDIYREQRMRLIDRDGEMIITMTSLKGVTDLIQDVFEGHDTIESKFAPLVNKELPRIVEKNGMRFYMFWTVENPHINQTRTKHEISLMTDQEIMSRIYGMPINLTGKIYMLFSNNVHVIPIDEAPISECQIWHVLDPHDRKPFAMAWYGVHPTGRAYKFEEYPNQDFNAMLYDDKTYDDYAEVIREKERGIKELYGVKVRKRVIDPNFGNCTVRLAEKEGGKSTSTCKKQLKARGFDFKDGIDALEEGHLRVREALHYKKKDGEIIVQPQFYITDNCQNSIKHTSRYSRKDIMTSDGDVKDKVKVKEKYKDFCFDNETEILTERGWKLFIDIREEKVATVDSNFYLEFQRPTRHIRYYYEGKMLSINAKCVNMSVTPEHKMMIVTQPTGSNPGQIKFRLAKDIKPQVRIPIACNGIMDEVGIEKITIGKYVVEGEDWGKFLGIYLSEGCAAGVNGGKIQIPGRGYSVYISQSKDSKHFNEIKDLLDRLPFHFKYNGKAFVVSCKVLWNKLVSLGNSHTKRFPEEVWSMSRKELLGLWKFLVYGDGWERNRDGTCSYCTISKKLFDDIQAMLTLLGIPSGVTIRKPSHKTGGLIKVKPKNGYATQYWITAKLKTVASVCKSGQDNREKQYSFVDYKGEVFCVTVPNGTLVVRRKNRVFLSGNCDLDRYFWMADPKFIVGGKRFDPEQQHERVY